MFQICLMFVCVRVFRFLLTCSKSIQDAPGWSQDHPKPSTKIEKCLFVYICLYYLLLQLAIKLAIELPIELPIEFPIAPYRAYCQIFL